MEAQRRTTSLLFFLLVISLSICIGITSASNNTTTTTARNSTNITTTTNTNPVTSFEPITSIPILSSITPLPSNCTKSFSCILDDDDDCLYDWASDHDECASTAGASCCPFGTFCVKSTSKCSWSNFGSPCTNSSDCKSIAIGDMLCVNSTCKYASSTGDGCDADTSICKPGLTCNSTTNLCSGAWLGESCDHDTRPCNNDLFCSNVTNTCQNLLGLNAACTSGAQCAYGFYCYDSDNNGRCKPYFSIEEGGSCNFSNQCSDGYVCGPGWTCVNPISQLTQCYSDSDCPIHSQCVCSQFSGVSYCQGKLIFDYCTLDRPDTILCQAQYNCTSISQNPSSCFHHHCYDQVKQLGSCGCQYANSLLGDCFYSAYCNDFPVWAIVLSVGTVLACFVIVGGIMYRSVRKIPEFELL